MRNETLYKLTTFVSLSLLAFMVLYDWAAKNVPVAFAAPTGVDCVKGRKGIIGKGCSGTVKLTLGPGGVINNTKKPFGLQVNTAVTDVGTAAIYGKQGAGSTIVGVSAGVLGDVTQGDGAAGYSKDGRGVVGLSQTGLGVFGRTYSTSNPGVFAMGGGDEGIALELWNGGIKVRDAGINADTPVFTHRVTTGGAGNVCAIQPYATVLDHPLTNGRSNAILMITPSYGANNTGVAPAVGVYAVYYDATNQCGKGTGKWVIYNLNSTALPNNSLINVLIVNGS